MKPLNLIIEGFRSFKKRQIFHFPVEPGLYFMRGDNRLEPRLGANGAGKSTTWDALCWVGWDKTPKGLRAGDISSWGGDSKVYVGFRFEVGGTMMLLERTRKPITWTLTNEDTGEIVDLTKDQTNPVLQLLRVQYEPFLHSVYMAQRGDMFLDLKPEPKAALFASVMGLDAWLEYSSKAGAAATLQDRESRRLENEHASISGQLTATDFGDLTKSAKEWEANRTTDLEDLAGQHEMISRYSHSLKLDLKKAEEDLKSQPAADPEMLSQKERVLAALGTNVQLVRELEFNMRDLESELKHVRLQLDTPAECPACKRPYGEQSQYKHVRRGKRAEETLLDKLDTCESTLESARNVASALEADLKLIEEDLQESRAAREALEFKVRDARRLHELEERKLDRIEENAERLERTENPYSKMLEERKRSADSLRKRLHEVTQQLDNSTSRHARYSYWVRGFKEVRLQMIADALNELEIEVNNEMMELGLVGWGMSFAVDSTTKSGTLSRGFTVRVVSPQTEGSVPWESWSGGESQRLRLSAQLGLSNLIRSRTGCALNLEVFDEPTEGLSEEGIQDLMLSLRERAIREQRIIWVVDHRAIGYGGFDGTTTVVKDASGSRLVQATL